MANRIMQFSPISEKGTAVIEAVVTLPVFLFIILTLLELSTIHFKNIALQHTVVVTARWAILGDTIDGLDRVHSIKSRAQKVGLSFGISIAEPNVTVCPVIDLPCPLGFDDAGAAAEFVQIEARVPYNFFMIYPLTLHSSAVIRNEPFA